MKVPLVAGEDRVGLVSQVEPNNIRGVDISPCQIEPIIDPLFLGVSTGHPNGAGGFPCRGSPRSRICYI